jgi:hypothetical protein
VAHAQEHNQEDAIFAVAPRRVRSRSTGASVCTRLEPFNFNRRPVPFDSHRSPVSFKSQKTRAIGQTLAIGEPCLLCHFFDRDRRKLMSVLNITKRYQEHQTSDLFSYHRRQNNTDRHQCSTTTPPAVQDIDSSQELCSTEQKKNLHKPDLHTPLRPKS